MSNLDPDAAARLRAFKISITAVLAFMLLTVFFSLPGNVLTRSWMGGLKNAFVTTAPQGWAFFTKNPESPDLYAYRDTPDGYASLLKTPQVKPANLFGLSRTQRAQGPELAGLARSTVHWRPCTAEDLSQCLKDARAQPTQSIVNTSPTPTLCGDLVLANERPTPWAYREFTSDTTRVQDSAHVQVTCG